MKLKEEMFSLISEWKKSKLPKHQFLSGKGISKDKFGYWVNKFNKQNKHLTGESLVVYLPLFFVLFETK